MRKVEKDPVKAVIFDMDGTLIDTEKYYRRYWPLAMAEFGYDMTDEQALAMRSMGRPYAAATLKEWFGSGLDYEKIRGRRRELMEQCLSEESIACKQGAKALLASLKKAGIVTAVATSTDPARTRRYLTQTGLLHYFDEVISAVQVEKGKPAPDIYLYACKSLGLAPSCCLAVEDAPNGVLSAYRAGCPVIMVPDQTEPDSETAKLLLACVDSLEKILPYAMP